MKQQIHYFEPRHSIAKQIQNMINEKDQAMDFGDIEYAKTVESQIMELMAVQDAIAIQDVGSRMQ